MAINKIPIWEKYILSVEEASQYFHIGENKIRRLMKEHEGAEWILWNASHAFIKRNKFEKFLDSIDSL